MGTPRFLTRLTDQLRKDVGGEGGRGRFFRLIFTVATVFCIGSLLEIGRIAWALGHGTVWVNIRGLPLSHSDMYTAIALSAVVAVCSAGIVVLLLQSIRGSR